MKLGNFLRTAGTAKPVNPHPVTFYAKGRDDSLRLVKAKVEAVLIFLDEDERTALRVQAREAAEKRFTGKVIPDGVYRDEESYHILFEALRQKAPNANGQHERLCDTIDELRSALVLREAQRLYGEYDLYLLKEFPPSIDDETWRKLLEEAKKNSASDLLTSYGFERVAAVLSFLAAQSGK